MNGEEYDGEADAEADSADAAVQAETGMMDDTGLLGLRRTCSYFEGLRAVEVCACARARVAASTGP